MPSSGAIRSISPRGLQLENEEEAGEELEDLNPPHLLPEFLADEDEAEEAAEAVIAVGLDEHGMEGDIQFNPRLYVQRYDAVVAVLEDPKWIKALKKIVDFGCSEWQFFVRLKKLEHAREIIGVDVDAELLDYIQRRIKPLLFDFLHPRSFCPLDVYLMCGNLANFDARLQHVDAITAIEVIEHLEPDVLERLPENLFGRLQPQLVILTTPNREFNVLFPHFAGPFRHWDHKFEWTRAEFEAWSHDVIRRYPEYLVTFSGVGYPDAVALRDTIGPCSQIATFVRKDFQELATAGGLSHILATDDERLVRRLEGQGSVEELGYRVVAHETFEHQVDDRSEHEKILTASQAFINSWIYMDVYRVNNSEDDEAVDADPDLFHIDLQMIVESPPIAQLQVDLDTVKRVLTQEGFNIDHDQNVLIFRRETEEESSVEDNYDYPEPATISHDPASNAPNTDEPAECWD
eukprot:maker-scaffold589_size129586-snap-gene-0.43 protein:Tk07341 transcript:maker-scaffold589_size129586-snap-gene-0.43-mRNA-1 annotation:"PREDICTED: uncharacterized protein LOC103574275"